QSHVTVPARLAHEEVRPWLPIDGREGFEPGVLLGDRRLSKDGSIPPRDNLESSLPRDREVACAVRIDVANGSDPTRTVPDHAQHAPGVRREDGRLPDLVRIPVVHAGQDLPVAIAVEVARIGQACAE